MPAGAASASGRRVFLGAAGLALLIGIAQLALWVGRVDQRTFPLPSTVLGSVADLARNGSFLASVGSTMEVWAESMVITVVIGVLAGLLLGSLPAVESAVRPVLEFIRPIPPVVLIPLVLLIVQDDTRTELVVIVFAAVWPVLINTISGVRGVEPLATETMRAFGFGPLAIVRLVSLPSAAPFIATGVRIATTYAFVVAIATELLGTGMAGIGAFAAAENAGAADVSVMIAIAVWSGLLGLAINGVFVAAERRLFRWHFSLTASAGGHE
jgi:NitT/TauT family transport system permease protein